MFSWSEYNSDFAICMLILQVKVLFFTYYGRNYMYLLAEHHVSFLFKRVCHSYMMQVQFIPPAVKWCVFTHCAFNVL